MSLRQSYLNFMCLRQAFVKKEQIWMLCSLTVERWETLIRYSKERARTQNSWRMRASLGRESGHPAEWSQLTPWPGATLQLLQQLSKSPILGTCLAVSLASSATTPLAFSPCCPTQHCLLDHKLNQEPVPISPVWTLTCTWLMQSCQALWRTRQDKGQAW